MFNRNSFLGKIFDFLRLYDPQLRIESDYPTKKTQLPYIVLREVSTLNPKNSNKIKIIQFEILWVNENKLKSKNNVDSLQNHFEQNFSLDALDFAVEDFNCTALGCYYDSNISAFVSPLFVICSLSVK